MLLRQYRILLKRTSKKFINLLLLLIIPFTAFYIKNLPVEEKRIKPLPGTGGAGALRTSGLLYFREMQFYGGIKGSGCIRAV